ncbi:MAG: hypothetical protein RL032_2292 [Pseudomonadota bacterium]|jgi:hypothetical protein
MKCLFGMDVNKDGKDEVSELMLSLDAMRSSLTLHQAKPSVWRGVTRY